MAALPYMQLYIADYLADTMHLSTEEHGAYLLLMFNYWQTGRAIPKNRLAKIARVSEAQWKDMEPTLKEFFEDGEDSWVHLRLERDIETVVTSPRGKKLPAGESLKGFNGYVYFINNPATGLIKIGYSKNPWARLAELRRNYGSDLSVAATIKTVDRSEVSIHAALAKFRVEGEWFANSECIKSLIPLIVCGEITTVDATRSYVDSYGSAATATTNKDTDKDIKPKNNMPDAESDQRRAPPEISPEDIFISLPLIGGLSHVVTLNYLESRRELYPAVDVPQELRNMCGWLESNPKKRKTPNGIKKFITTWLQRCQDNPKNRQVTNGQNPAGNAESIAERQLREGREQYIRERQHHGGHSGMAAVGPHDKNLQQPLDCEEWQSSIGPLGAADWRNEQ